MPRRKMLTMMDHARSVEHQMRYQSPPTAIKKQINTAALYSESSVTEETQHQAALAIVTQMKDAPPSTTRQILDMLGLILRKEERHELPIHALGSESQEPQTQ